MVHLAQLRVLPKKQIFGLLGNKRTVLWQNLADCLWNVEHTPGGRLNIKMTSYQYRDSHVKDKTVSLTVYIGPDTISHPASTDLPPTIFTNLPRCNKVWFLIVVYIDGLEQDCSISSALAMYILQSCTKPLICRLGCNFFKWYSVEPGCRIRKVIEMYISCQSWHSFVKNYYNGSILALKKLYRRPTRKHFCYMSISYDLGS